MAFWPFNKLLGESKVKLEQLPSLQTLKESNSLWGTQTLGNWILVGGKNGATYQLLYVTLSDTTRAGQFVDVTYLTRNSTVMACVGWLSRAIAQMKIRIQYLNSETGEYESYRDSKKISAQDQAKAKQVLRLLNNPNNFQTQYEFFAQMMMWQCLTGEVFLLCYRNNQDDPLETPKELYVLDSTLITTRVTPMRYPSYRLSSPTYGFNQGAELADYQVIHVCELPWQGVAGFNKLIQASELVNLSQQLDESANFVLQNSAKPSGVFITEQEIPQTIWEQYKARLSAQWADMQGSRNSDENKPGQTMLLDKGLKFETMEMPQLQSATSAELKKQVDSRLCGLLGVAPTLVGIAADTKFNNATESRNETYKNTLFPFLQLLSQRLTKSLFAGYPNLKIDFETMDFLKGDLMSQVQVAGAGIKNSIMTVNEARLLMGLPRLPDMDVLQNLNHAEPDGDESPMIMPRQKDDGDDDDINQGQNTGGGGGGSKVTRLPLKRSAM